MKAHLKYARDVLKSPAQSHKEVFWGSSSGSMNLKLLKRLTSKSRRARTFSLTRPEGPQPPERV